MHVPGERVLRLCPLDCPPEQPGLTASEVIAYPAVRLFAERVSARRGEFSLSDDEAPMVAEICRKLDGIALAIELAAGRAAVFGVRNTVARLGSRLDHLKFGRRTANPRHQTLMATLDWSHDHLSEVERVVLRRVAIFIGHFTLEAALAVAEEGGIDRSEIAGALGNLVNKSLIGRLAQLPGDRFTDCSIRRAPMLWRSSPRAASKIPLPARHARLFDSNAGKQPGQSLRSGVPEAQPDAVRDYLGNIRAALEWSFGPEWKRRHGHTIGGGGFAAVSGHVAFLECRALDGEGDRSDDCGLRPAGPDGNPRFACFVAHVHRREQ